MKKEEILSTETIFDGRIIHLKRYKVRLANGEEGIREIIVHQGAVAIVAVDDKQQLLMVKQFRTGSQSILYEVPAGLIEEGEAAEAAAIREMREETRYRPLQIESIGGIYLSPAYNTEFVQLFFVKAYESDPEPLDNDGDEFVEVVRIPFSEALAMIDRGEIVNATTVTALLKAARLLAL
jgi:ADP-ribose pyrophosphatase